MFAVIFLTSLRWKPAQITPERKIVGRVADDQGNPLPGVSVEPTSPKMVGAAYSVTDKNGTYRLMTLPSGTYDITFSLPGFEKVVRKGISLVLAQTIVLNVIMEVATLEEEVVVVGKSPLIDVKSTVKGQVMARDVIMSLPRGRNFDSLINLVPGVHYESKIGGFTTDGASGAENIWPVDGTDVTSIHVGTRAQNVVLELVDEVKVTASGYNAEFGGSMGGVINVITRSGGNTFHGDFIAYYKNNKLWMKGKAHDYLTQSPYNVDVYEYVNDDDLYFDGGKKRDSYYRTEFAISLGGYIIKDRLWFFGAFNPIKSQTKALRDFNSRKGPFSEFLTKSYYYNGSFKLTAAPLKNLRLSASLVNNFYKYRGALPRISGTSSATYDWGKEGYDYPDNSTAFLADYHRGNNLLISLRGGWHKQNITNQQIKPPDRSTYYFYTSNYIYQNDPFFQSRPDLLHYAYWTDSPIYLETQKRLYEKFSSNLDFTYYMSWMGEHAWKAGIQYIWLHEDVLDWSPHPRVYIYWGRTSYALGFPVGVGAPKDSPYYGPYGYYYIRSSWTGLYGGVWNASSNNWALYLQDSWTIKDRLTINAGIRAESEYIPSFTDDPMYAHVKNLSTLVLMRK